MNPAMAVKMLAMLGSQNGERVARATFAVILKLSGMLETFEQLVTYGGDLAELDGNDSATLIKMFENASQIRKWTQD